MDFVWLKNIQNIQLEPFQDEAQDPEAGRAVVQVDTRQIEAEPSKTIDNRHHQPSCKLLEIIF